MATMRKGGIVIIAEGDVSAVAAFLGYAVAIGVWMLVGYVVVKLAVKNAILEAHEKIAAKKLPESEEHQVGSATIDQS